MSHCKGLAETKVTVDGVIFAFRHRRYGKQIFTWLFYKDADDKWQEYRYDPWMSSKVPNADLKRIAAELKSKVDPYLELREVCEMFDVGVMQDYWPGTDDHPEAGHPMFSLGQNTEVTAGIRGFRLTPWFDSPLQLAEFCHRNYCKFCELKSADTESVPDATGWM